MQLDNEYTKAIVTESKWTDRFLSYLLILSSVGGLWTTLFGGLAIVLNFYAESDFMKTIINNLYLVKKRGAKESIV